MAGLKSGHVLIILFSFYCCHAEWTLERRLPGEAVKRFDETRFLQGDVPNWFTLVLVAYVIGNKPRTERYPYRWRTVFFCVVDDFFLLQIMF